MASSPKTKRRIGRWIFLGLLLAAVVWVIASGNPFAQGIRTFAGGKHDQSVLANSFTVSPRGIRYYKFSLPEGSKNVSIVGQFTAKAEGSAEAGSTDGDNTIEVYVLSDIGFAAWQRGNAESSVYQSGRVAQGAVQADMPAGAGTYYVVFSNRFSTSTAKNVNATVSLHYKSWLSGLFAKTKPQ
jgi:hypothetical protein